MKVNKMKPFYVKHKTEEEAREIIELAVANGANKVNTLESIGWRYWKYVGVDKDNDTLINSYVGYYGENAIELTIEEVRKMFEKKSSDKYMPEVGEVCLYQDMVGLTKTKILAFHPDGAGVWHEALEFFEDGSSYSTDDINFFQPLKTKDETEREEVISSMRELTFSITPTDDRDDYGILYDAGFRFIANDEVIVKPLSDEQIETIRDKCIEMMPTFRDAIEIIQRELGVIE